MQERKFPVTKWPPPQVLLSCSNREWPLSLTPSEFLETFPFPHSLLCVVFWHILILLWFIFSAGRTNMETCLNTLNCKVRRVRLHLLDHHDGPSHWVRQFTTEFFFLFFFFSSRIAERSKHLIYYYPITEHDILIQSVGTHNKLEITLSASLYDNWLHLLTFLHLWYHLEHLVLTFLHTKNR